MRWVSSTSSRTGRESLAQSRAAHHSIQGDFASGDAVRNVRNALLAAQRNTGRRPAHAPAFEQLASRAQVPTKRSRSISVGANGDDEDARDAAAAMMLLQDKGREADARAGGSHLHVEGALPASTRPNQPCRDASEGHAADGDGASARGRSDRSRAHATDGAPAAWPSKSGAEGGEQALERRPHGSLRPESTAAAAHSPTPGLGCGWDGAADACAAPPSLVNAQPLSPSNRPAAPATPEPPSKDDPRPCDGSGRSAAAYAGRLSREPIVGALPDGKDSPCRSPTTPVVQERDSASMLYDQTAPGADSASPEGGHLPTSPSLKRKTRSSPEPTPSVALPPKRARRKPEGAADRRIEAPAPRELSVRPDQTCDQCGTDSTPLWRKNRRFGMILCNKCGIYLKTHGKMRPVDGFAREPVEMDEQRAPVTPQQRCEGGSTPHRSHLPSSARHLPPGWAQGSFAGVGPWSHPPAALPQNFNMGGSSLAAAVAQQQQQQQQLLARLLALMGAPHMLLAHHAHLLGLAGMAGGCTPLAAAAPPPYLPVLPPTLRAALDPGLQRLRGTPPVVLGVHGDTESARAEVLLDKQSHAPER